MFCSNVTHPTQQQLHTLRTLEERVMTVFRRIRETRPNEKLWQHVLKNWNGRVFLGGHVHTPEYSRETGCLSIGLDSNGSRDIIPRLTARLIMKLVRETASNAGCIDELRTVLDFAHRQEIPVELSCDDIRENGLHDSTWADDRHCSSLAEGGRRMTFPELIGRNVDDAVAMIRRGYPYHHIVTRRWDIMGTQAEYDGYRPNETVVIFYDDVSKRVVLPEPQLASMATMHGIDQHCFMMPEDGQCIGAPARRPKEWDRLIGTLLIDANDTMRFHYPHALIETMPNTARFEPTHRRDRIRILFDPRTALTTDIILG